MSLPIDNSTGYYLYGGDEMLRDELIRRLQKHNITTDKYNWLRDNDRHMMITHLSRVYVENLLDGKIVDDAGNLVYNIFTKEGSWVNDNDDDLILDACLDDE